MRRYIVKGFAGHPGWSGCIWAVGCSKVQSAESLFERRVAAGYGSADAIVMIDRESHEVVKAWGTDDPKRLLDTFGW